MPKQVVCDGINYIDKGNFVIIVSSKKSVVPVKYAKRLERRYFMHKNVRHYIVK